MCLPKYTTDSTERDFSISGGSYLRLGKPQSSVLLYLYIFGLLLYLLGTQDCFYIMEQEWLHEFKISKRSGLSDYYVRGII